MLLIWMKQDKGNACEVKPKTDTSRNGGGWGEGRKREMTVSACFLEMWSSLPERTAKNVDSGCPWESRLEVRFFLSINSILLYEF